MASRLDLHNELITFCPNVYFQPPSNLIMKYPCIVYDKTNRMKLYGSDVIHFSKQEYRITVIDRNPDTEIPDQIEKNLLYCGVDQYYTIDNLNHTVLSLYY
jgi:predicted membrane-bound spermidine synthase